MIKIIKIIVVVLVAALLTATCVNLIIYRNDNDNRAIIVIHGTIGGGLVDASGNPVWDPYGGDHSVSELVGGDPISLILDFVFGREYTDTTREILDGVLTDSPDSFLRKLTSDEDGNVKDNGIVAANSVTGLPNGALNAYKGIYDGLNEEFGEDIDVVMFQYDWREDNRISAQHLEDFIKDGGWEEVIICAHSMGNHVTSSYLAKSKENRDKVRGYMALAGPFYGATMAITFLENPYSFIEGIQTMVNENPLLSTLLGDRIEQIYEQQAIPLIYNMASVGQLLPTIKYATALKEFYGTNFLTVNGEEITTNQQLMEFYLSRPWAKKTNGELRAFIADFNNYQESFYVEVDGKKYHASELVHTIYFAGINCNTSSGLVITNNEFINTITNNLGDGTVPLYSATLGRKPEDYDNIHTYSGKGHYDVGMSYEGQLKEDLGAAIRFLL